MENEWILFDAGMFIGALLLGDPRHAEARPLVEAARQGTIQGCTTTGILCEVYASPRFLSGFSLNMEALARTAFSILVAHLSKFSFNSCSQNRISFQPERL